MRAQPPQPFAPETPNPIPVSPGRAGVSPGRDARAQPSPQPSRRVRQLEPQQLVPRAAPEPSQNRASRPQHGPWAPSAESGEKWAKTSKSKDGGLPTLFAAGPGRRRRATERGTRAVQTEPRALNTVPGRRVRRVGKSGVKLVRVKMGVCRHFLQPAAGRTDRAAGAPPRETHTSSPAESRGRPRSAL